jgi:PAS domain-containing protein
MAGKYAHHDRWPDTWRQRWQALLTEVTPDESIDGPLAGHFRARQIQALLSVLPLVMLGNAFNTVTICWTFWGRMSRPWLAAWCISVTLSLTVVGFWWKRLMSAGPRPSASRQATSLITVQVMVFAALWSGLPIAVFPASDHTGAMLIATVTVGMICSGAFTLSPIVSAATAYLAVFGVACMIGLARSDYGSSAALMLLLVVYLVVMAGVVYTNGRALMGRLRAEGETERQKQLIDLLLRDFEEHASDWLWEISPTGHLRHVSTRLAQSFGKPPRLLLQRSLVELLADMLVPDDEAASAALARLNSFIRMGQPFRDLEIPVEIGHEVHWWSLTAKPLHDEHGRAAGWRGRVHHAGVWR